VAGVGTNGWVGVPQQVRDRGRRQGGGQLSRRPYCCRQGRTLDFPPLYNACNRSTRFRSANRHQSAQGGDLLSHWGGGAEPGEPANYLRQCGHGSSQFPATSLLHDSLDIGDPDLRDGGIGADPVPEKVASHSLEGLSGAIVLTMPPVVKADPAPVTAPEVMTAATEPEAMTAAAEPEREDVVRDGLFWLGRKIATLVEQTDQ
jgi:hypothetical protein